MLRKSFLLLMIGEVISGIGIWLGIIGNLQFMNHLIDSDFIKSLILMSGVLASLLFLPLSGKWIDKMEKRKILIYSSMLRCLSPVCMFPALAFDSIPWMMASLILNQVTSAVYFPTVRTSLPVLVDKTELLQANTIYMNIVTISRITGTAVGGIMVASLSLNDLYLGSLGGFLILTIITCFVRIPPGKASRPAGIKKRSGSVKSLPYFPNSLPFLWASSCLLRSICFWVDLTCSFWHLAGLSIPGCNGMDLYGRGGKHSYCGTFYQKVHGRL
ncbi:MFS transporter [Paenibacillus larvae]|nr:MFS transporter [Paenibacillus larvae]MDT2255673.1 MFS transporter [Paenibacillus larvae]